MDTGQDLTNKISQLLDEQIFVAGLHSSDWKSRLHALEQVGEISEQYPERTFSVLVACLVDKEPLVRTVAAFYVKNLRKDVIIDYIAFLLGGNDGMRWTGLMAAEAIDESYLIPVLKKVNDPEFRFQLRVNHLIQELEN